VLTEACQELWRSSLADNLDDDPVVRAKCQQKLLKLIAVQKRSANRHVYFAVSERNHSVPEKVIYLSLSFSSPLLLYVTLLKYPALRTQQLVGVFYSNNSATLLFDLRHYTRPLICASEACTKERRSRTSSHTWPILTYV
jgi:hypothetical protein